jgi:hypothetical protein
MTYWVIINIIIIIVVIIIIIVISEIYTPKILSGRCSTTKLTCIVEVYFLKLAGVTFLIMTSLVV